MSSSSNRRRLAPLIGLVLGTVLLVGCGTRQGSASSYDGMEVEFIKGCEATVEADEEAAAEAGDEIVSLPPDYCECAFEALSDDDGYDFDELKEINAEFIKDPAALPDDVTAVFADCATLS